MSRDAKLLDAVRRGDLKDCVEWLAKGADADARDEFDSALTIAVRARDTAIRDLLIKKGADVNLPAHGRIPALMITAAAGDIEGCRALLSAGAAIDAIGECHEDALSYAAAYGHSDVCELLLESGADINSSDMYGSSALTESIKGDHRNVFDLLLARGAEVQFHDAGLAAYCGRSEMLTGIMAAIESTQKDLWDLVLSEAVRGGQVELCRSLMVSGPCPSFDADHLWCAATKGDVVMSEFLLEQGVDVNEIGESRAPALHAAACAGSAEVVRLFLANGADVHLESDKIGWTALYEAIRSANNVKDNVEVCRLLLAGGADTKPLCLRPKDFTPFQAAVFTGRAPIAVMLADECNEDLEQLTVDGKTMEELAGVWSEVVEALRSVAASRAVFDGLCADDSGPTARPRSMSMSPL